MATVTAHGHRMIVTSAIEGMFVAIEKAILADWELFGLGFPGVIHQATWRDPDAFPGLLLTVRCTPDEDGKPGPMERQILNDR